jgi:hypothetical protein
MIPDYTQSLLLKEASSAIRRGKYAVAASYLVGMPDCEEVSRVREQLRRAKGLKTECAEMNNEERDAHDNR